MQSSVQGGLYWTCLLVISSPLDQSSLHLYSLWQMATKSFKVYPLYVKMFIRTNKRANVRNYTDRQIIIVETAKLFIGVSDKRYFNTA